MSYKFLIINTDYPEFLKWLYAQNIGLETKPYAEQMRVRNESLFGVADFYSRNLGRLGHEVYDIHVNNEMLQKAWAKEHGLRVNSNCQLQFFLKKGIVPWVSLAQDRSWFYDILTAQVKHYKPDVLLNYDIGLRSQFFRELRPYIRLLVGQYAAPLPHKQDLSVYDLIISSLPNLVNYFRQQNINSELYRLGFEPIVLDRLGEENKTIPVSFVGSLSQFHASRKKWLNAICRYVNVMVWGQGIDGLFKMSPLSNSYQGAAWGLEVYRILRASKITLNHHIDIAGSYANNMRLFEATGVGTLLISDWKENLHEMFEPGKEVLVYRSAEECAELIRYYLEHDTERKAIAKAGQERTIKEHTYFQRMQELVKILQRFF